MADRWLCALACGIVLAFPGTAAAASVGFAPPQVLPGGGPASGSVHTAMAPNGYAITGWADALPGSEHGIAVSVRPPGASWSDAQQLDVGSQTPSRFSVAIDNAGDAVVAWDGPVPAPPMTDVQVATRAAGQPAFAVSNTFLGASQPSAGIANGAITLVDYESGDAVARTWNIKGSLILSQTIAHACTMLFPPQVAVAATGDAVAVADCGGATFARRIGGVWSTSTPIPNLVTPTCSPGNPGIQQDISAESARVAIDDHGRPAGVVLEGTTTMDCTIMTSSFGSAVDLVLAAGGSMKAITPPVATASEFELVTGNALTAPDVGMLGGAEFLGWGSLPFAASTSALYTATYNASGSQTTAPAQVSGSANSPAEIAAGASGYGLDTWTGPPGGLLAALIVGPAGNGGGILATGASGATSAIGDAGNGLIGFVQGSGAAARAEVIGFEATSPTISRVSAPRSVKVHRRASFRATATDFWGPLTFSWRFGPHAIATGPSVQHTFSKPGIKQVKLTVTDGAKLTVSRTVSVRVTRPARKHRRHRKHRARRA